jgi:hypothetical protein
LDVHETSDAIFGRVVILIALSMSNGPMCNYLPYIFHLMLPSLTLSGKKSGVCEISDVWRNRNNRFFETSNVFKPINGATFPSSFICQIHLEHSTSDCSQVYGFIPF